MIRESVLPMFKESLLSGTYNLLLGSGISLDSKNGSFENLPSTEALRKDLCRITGAPENTLLTHVAALLNEEQVHSQLTLRFLDCTPGSSLRHLPHYIWRRVFTFNIDDVLCNLYEGSRDRKQTIEHINFTYPFEPTPYRSNLQVIHLHGSVQEPDDGYVFSHSEYAQVMSSNNPWMHLLSEILATESFIIAGTSLNEVDLEYYLSFRSEKTPRKDRGPSIIVTPDPTVVTQNACKRYKLELFEGTFGDFLAWLRREVPSAPSIYDQIVPDIENLFTRRPTAREQLLFFSDYELVSASSTELPSIPTGFLYGREPKWSEIDSHLDIERIDNARLIDCIRELLADSGDGKRLIVVTDKAGTGKTTVVKRVTHDLLSSGIPVLNVCTQSRINPEVSINCLQRVKKPVLLLVDGIADHAYQIAEILEDPKVRAGVVVLATERNYRKEYLCNIFGKHEVTYWMLESLSESELVQLVERYRGYGLVADRRALENSRDFAVMLSRDPLAVAICRIMNDFQPLAEIVKSLWVEANEHDKFLYLCVSLTCHCLSTGLLHSILQRIAGPRISISHLFEYEQPLSLSHHISDDDYVVTSNASISEQILLLIRDSNPELIMGTFKAVAANLAPHVNRNAIMRRSPEARLAGRLFDCDVIVKPLLGKHAEDFYTGIQDQWEWNSRYWEQRALLVSEWDIDRALHYARHAVAIEKHPYSLTTLGKVLFMKMEHDPDKRIEVFEEAFTSLTEAIELEFRRTRSTIHPYVTLLGGAARYLRNGGMLTEKQSRRIGSDIEEARYRFGRVDLVTDAIARLEEVF